MKKLFLVLSICFGTLLSMVAQDVDNQESLLKAGLLGPGIEYELKLSNTATIIGQAGAGFSVGYGGNEVGWLSDYVMYTEISPRYYYNFDNRLENGKPIDHFSGNYISLYTRAYLYEVLSSVENEPNQYLIGPTWGLQRDLGKGWYYNLQLGAGASITENETIFAPIIGFDIGFQLN